MQLRELFNRPVPWEWDYQNDGSWGADFTVNQVNYDIRIEVVEEYNDETGNFEQNGDWRVEFGESGSYDAYGITGKQKQQAVLVFSTVIDILTQFKKAHPDAALMFTADEPSRQKLYSRIVASMQKLGYKVSSEPYHNGLKYYVG